MLSTFFSILTNVKGKTIFFAFVRCKNLTKTLLNNCKQPNPQSLTDTYTILQICYREKIKVILNENTYEHQVKDNYPKTSACDNTDNL